MSRRSRQLVMDLLRGSRACRQLVTRNLATSPTSLRRSYEEVNNVTRKLRGTGSSGIWPLSSIWFAICLSSLWATCPNNERWRDLTVERVEAVQSVTSYGEYTFSRVMFIIVICSRAELKWCIPPLPNPYCQMLFFCSDKSTNVTILTLVWILIWETRQPVS